MKPIMKIRVPCLTIHFIHRKCRDNDQRATKRKKRMQATATIQIGHCQKRPLPFHTRYVIHTIISINTNHVTVRASRISTICTTSKDVKETSREYIPSLFAMPMTLTYKENHTHMTLYQQKPTDPYQQWQPR